MPAGRPANPVNNFPMLNRWRKPETLRVVMELAGFDSVEMREDIIVLDWPTLEAPSGQYTCNCHFARIGS